MHEVDRGTDYLSTFKKSVCGKCARAADLRGFGWGLQSAVNGGAAVDGAEGM